VSIVDIGRAAGYRGTELARDLDGLHAVLSQWGGRSGPHLLVMKVAIAPVVGIERILHSPQEIRDRFKHSVQTETQIEC
jgi:hypothetical protein